MRVVFMGSPEFAVPSLDALVEAGHEVIAVVAQPDRPAGRGRRLRSPATVERARALGLPVRQPRAIRRGPFVEWFRSCGADVAVVVAYGRILPPVLLEAPARGCINVHASLLPRHRGAAPVQWALIRGDAETGCCTMRLDEGLDTGPVLAAARTPIDPDATAGELSARLSVLGARLLVDTLARLDETEPRPQDDARATLAPPLTKDDGNLRWSEPARALHDRVRGTNPWPGARARLGGEPLKVWRTRVVAEDGAPGAPGEVLEAGDRLVVACGRGAVEIREAQLPGRRRVSGVDLARGRRLRVGDRLEDWAAED